jgi:hypothetical protein
MNGQQTEGTGEGGEGEGERGGRAGPNMWEKKGPDQPPDPDLAEAAGGVASFRRYT